MKLYESKIHVYSAYIALLIHKYVDSGLGYPPNGVMEGFVLEAKTVAENATSALDKVQCYGSLLTLDR
jgi:hypothetical protein